MANLTIVTGWSPAGFESYGRRFLKTFGQYVKPDMTHLEVYTNERQEQDIRECAAFLARHKDNLAAQGMEPQLCWKDKERVTGYSFRTDAYKFCRQVYSVWHAACHAHTEYIAWFDGDIVFTAPFDPVKDIIALLPRDKDLAYLGRSPWHSEIGFQLYRRVDALPMLYDFVGYYTSDKVFELHEWHSAFAFDKARKQSGILAHNLTPEPGSADVWSRSPLKRWSRHLKGNLKNVAK